MTSPFPLIRTGLLAACLAGLAPVAALAAEVSVRLGHVLPESHSWHVAATGFAEEVNQRTDGRVAIEVFPSGQLGSEKEVIEGMQFGSVQAGLIGSGSFQGIEPRMGIIEMPYAWGARDQAFAALDGELGAELAGMLDAKGIKVLGWWENGFRNITNNVRPIETPEDLAGLKIRVTPDKVRLATFEGLGAEPAPLSFGELYSALQQGLFDAQENPLAIIYSASFFEVQKYVSLSEHIWGAATLTMSNATWNKIAPEDQEIVMEAATSWGLQQRDMVAAANDELIAQLKDKGMQFNEVDKAAFIDAVAPIWESQKDVYGEELLSVLDQYRK
ncbi:MAG: DctP family TRAP transporter solute-binding subunit [Marinovum algicola]|jgi:tripartite ATP-independent transporter DctP family solute receptor|uniref:Tripartite ATP-independent transporter solute receptor, DctP family n=1 Tax=Marinovum algicola TaxID=42444 RepID=A0A975WAM1_9RHOB|nr:DctP family TRAP transporter solute-binding subunit [Marinovum algicola]SEJ61596.1 tripartite ATP-independent transporter solute receptor, DctP family [Marinovum algicola]SLN52018.1 2,3-diketo-L-gulonate-binding periplasmic protein YiaO precursor [Marinovum algicola]